MPSKINEIHDFKPARLVKGSMKSQPYFYVEFSAFDAISGKLRRKRITQINSIENLEQREIAGNKLVSEINELLLKGYHFNDVKSKDIERHQIAKVGNKVYTLEKALEYAYEIKMLELAKKSIANYKHAKNYLLKFSDYQSLRHQPISFIEKSFAFEFLDYLRVIQKLKGQTINAIISQCKGLFAVLVEREIVGENIFRVVRKQKEIKSIQNIAYAPDQIKKLKEFLQEHDLFLWNFCQFVFYSFMRPNEIRQLTFSNVNLEKRYIYLSAEKSKTKRERYVFINDSFLEVLRDLLSKVENENHLIFNKNSDTPTKPMGTNTLSNQYRIYLDKLNFEKHFTIYSWKHTGNVMAYKSGIDIYSLMKQNGHTSVDTTLKYLKSLGLVMDKELTDKFNLLKI